MSIIEEFDIIKGLYQIGLAVFFVLNFFHMSINHLDLLLSILWLLIILNSGYCLCECHQRSDEKNY